MAEKIYTIPINEAFDKAIQNEPCDCPFCLLQEMLEQNELDHKAIKCIASIDLKADEEGLLKYCEDNGLTRIFYSSAELLEVPGTFTPSAFVQSVTGVDNVCERAALRGADKLIVKKTALNGVTVAVAAEKLEVRFG
mgnify:CR=1 FL=1